MKALRAIASLCVFLILAFFLIGLGSSNDWEGGGTLAKIVLIPICLVLGLLLFKLAAPLFSVSPSTRVNPSAEARTREKISGNRYRMGNDLPTSYALTVLGLILLFVSISREDTSLGIVSLAVFLFSFRMRGRLQTERNIAKSIGARTLKNDVEDAVVGTVELAGTAAKFVFDKGITSFQKLLTENSQNTPIGSTSKTSENQTIDKSEGGTSIGRNMVSKPTGAFKLYSILKDTNNLNGDWGPTDWLYCWVMGNDETKEFKKVPIPTLNPEDFLEKYRLTAKQCQLLIQLVFDFRSSRFANVIKRINLIKQDDDYKNLETYIFWFHKNSIGRSDLSVPEEISATNSPDLHQALLLLEKNTVEIVPTIFEYVTDLILEAENS